MQAAVTGWEDRTLGRLLMARFYFATPFMPAAPEVSKDVPISIGWNKVEMTILMAAQPWFGALDFPTLESMAPIFGAKGKPLID